MLPAEFEALELNAPQQAPSRLFSVSGRAAKFVRFLDLSPVPSERTPGATGTSHIHGFAVTRFGTPSPVSPRLDDNGGGSPPSPQGGEGEEFTSTDHDHWSYPDPEAAWFPCYEM